MFQQYQNGVTPVTGMSEAGANIGNMYASGIMNAAKGLTEGIKAYNENSAKSEMANVKIASLSQDIANKIAMYSQDPEIAQSGVLQGLMQKGQMLTEAPTKGLSQRLAIAHDAETSLAGFGQQLQEWSFLRGRAIERGIAEGLKLFENAKTTTDPVFYKGNDPELLVDPNQTIQQQKDRVMARFKQIRAANPQIQGTEEDFWAGWLNDAQQQISKAQGLHPSVVSAQLEALQAEKNIAKNQKAVASLDDNAISGLLMNKDGMYEEQAPIVSSVKDYAAMTAVPADKPYNDVAEGMKMLGYETDKSNIPELSKKLAEEKKNLSELQGLLSSGNYNKENEEQRKFYDTLSSMFSAISPADGLMTAGVKKRLSELKDEGKKITPELVKSVVGEMISKDDKWKNFKTGAYGYAGIINRGLVENVKNPVKPIYDPQNNFDLGKRLSVSETKTAEQEIRKALGNVTSELLIPDSLQTRVSKAKENISKLEREIKTETPVKAPAPKVALGDLVVGLTETTRPLTVSERKSQVSDFLTERFGAIDPTDPTGKKRIAVQGFDSFFQKAIPESEIKEFTTEGGTRLIHLNGKWEMVKESTPRTMKQVREDLIGVYGKQTADGRLVPTEFIPNSGIEIGGLYRGTDASEAQFNDEMVQLSDARRSIKKLQEINDSVGEFADLTKAGIAEVEVMNLKSALRKDIIGVGTVSNFEQSLIDKVIRNPTDFFSMESKDRAILLALAQRIDRRIQNVGAAKGLTVRIRDVNSANRYEALRQQYLKAKGII